MSSNSISQKELTLTGSIPAHYEEFLGPMFFEPFAIEVAERINPSSVGIALELAAGTGRVTRHLLQILPSTAELIASDISPDMLAIAKEKINNPRIDWRIIDLNDLPFEDSSIDLVVCCFGFMFAEDKSAAFAEVRRVLKAGGMLIFTTWDSLEYNGASMIYRELVKKFLEPPLPKTFHLPFSMYDEQIITSLLQQVSFSKIKIEKIEKMASAETAKKAADGLSRGGSIYNELMKRNPAWVDEIRALLEKKLEQNFGDSPMVAPMSAIICRAWK